MVNDEKCVAGILFLADASVDRLDNALQVIEKQKDIGAVEVDLLKKISHLSSGREILDKQPLQDLGQQEVEKGHQHDCQKGDLHKIPRHLFHPSTDQISHIAAHGIRKPC